MRISNRRLRGSYIRRMRPKSLASQIVFYVFVSLGWAAYLAMAYFPKQTTYWVFENKTGELTQIFAAAVNKGSHK